MMNKQQAWALYKEFTASERPSNPLLYAAKHLAYRIGLASKDARLVLLKAYLESLDEKQEISYQGFRHFLLNTAPELLVVFEDLSDSTLPCLQVFLALHASRGAEPTKKEQARAPSDLLSTEVDLSLFPETSLHARPAASLRAELSLGDLHGNAIKLIYSLLREKVVNGLTKTDYSRLQEIYAKTVADLTETDIEEFEAILAKMNLSEAAPSLVRLIGDTLCDRGQNDIFTLLVLKRLDELKVPIKIEASNHDIEFVKAYQLSKEGEITFAKTELSKEKDQTSLANLKALLAKFPKLARKVSIMVEEHYLPKLELLSYTLGPDGKSITIFTHAPVGLETLRALADHFKITFKDTSLSELAKTIDAINEAVASHGGVAAVYTLLKLTPAEFETHPLSRIVWNYSAEGLDRPAIHGAVTALYQISWVHGHARKVAFPGLAHIINLDSKLGKSDDDHTGDYRVAYSAAMDPASCAKLLAASPSSALKELFASRRRSHFADLDLGSTRKPGLLIPSSDSFEDPGSVRRYPDSPPLPAARGSDPLPTPPRLII